MSDYGNSGSIWLKGHIGYMFRYNVSLCIYDASCKVIIPYGDPLDFYSATKKSVRIGT